MAVADIAAKFAAFLLTPYLANQMGPTEFGLLNIYLSIIQILTTLIALGGAGLLAVEYVRNGYDSARRLRAANLRLSLWVAVALLAVSQVISFLAPSIVPTLSGLLIVAVSFVQALNVCELSYYRGAQSYPFAVAGQFIFAVLNIVLTVLAFEFESPTATNRLLALALAGGIVQTLYALELRGKRYDKGDPGTARANRSLIFRFGISLFIHQASQWIRSSVDRFVIFGFLGLAAAGVYSVAVTLAMVEAMFFNAIAQQLQPFLYHRLKRKDFQGYQRIQLGFFLAVVLFTGLYFFALNKSFSLLFNEEYAPAKALLPILLASSAAQSIYHVVALACFYERRGNAISSVTALALIFHLAGLGTLSLIGKINPQSVATTFLFSSVIAMGGMALLASRTIRHLRLSASV